MATVSQALGWTLAVAVSLYGQTAAASSVGAYGVSRQTMLEPPQGGRPVTFSVFDIFACLDRPGAGEVYQVPYRYVTDQTSIPSGLTKVLTSRGFNPLFSNAAIVHDYLYAAGKPGAVDVQKRVDEDFVTLMRSEQVDENTLGKVRTAFRLLRNLPLLKNPFGADKEWLRWADLTTLAFARTDTPVRPARVDPVVTLASCRAFDDRSVATHLTLHSCLHYRYMSTRDERFWPPFQPARQPPLIPTPLLARPDQIRAYLSGDCSQFA